MAKESDKLKKISNKLINKAVKATITATKEDIGNKTKKSQIENRIR